jgi:hypothetical protein
LLSTSLIECTAIFFWRIGSRTNCLRAFVAFDAFFGGGKIGFKSGDLNILTSKARKKGFVVAWKRRYC